MNMIGLKGMWKFVLIWVLLVGFVAIVWHSTNGVGAQANGTELCVGVSHRNNGSAEGEPLGYLIFQGTEEKEWATLEKKDVTIEQNNKACFHTRSPLVHGTYHIAFLKSGSKHYDYLTVIETFTVAANTTKFMLETTLEEGDINNDDKITGSDASILLSSYEPCSGPNYNRDEHFDADFNEDGCVSDVELGILQSHDLLFEIAKGASHDVLVGDLHDVLYVSCMNTTTSMKRKGTPCEAGFRVLP